MKNLKKKFLVISTMLLIFSCSKNDVSEEIIQENSIKYFFNEKEVSLETIDESLDLIYFYPKPDEVHIFNDNQKYEAYLVKLSNNLPTDEDWQKKAIQRTIKANRIATKISALADLNNLNKNSEPSQEIYSLFSDLNKLEDNSHKAGTILYVTLYEETDFRGRSGSFPNTVLKLRNSWKNKASSYKAGGFGIVTLCDKNFFRGSKRVYARLSVHDLGQRGFDNRTQSFF